MTLPAIVIRLELEQPPRLLIEAEHDEDARRLMRWVDGNPELLELVLDAKILEGRPRADEDALRRLAADVTGVPGETVVPFGQRHPGRTIADIYADDPDYVAWLASSAVKDEFVRASAVRFLAQIAPELLR